jgi:predicted DNA-binding transcriptional regulator AlpA
MTPLIDSDDLIDAQEVARLAGLGHASTVSGYLRRYPDMPRPVVAKGGTRARLWLRPDVVAWLAKRKPEVDRTLGLR